MEGAWGLRAVESVTSYFALALLVALVVLWLQEEAENGKNYMRWLKSQRLEDIEKLAGRSLRSSENGSDQAETNQPLQPTASPRLSFHVRRL